MPTLSDDDLVTALSGLPVPPAKPDAVLVQALTRALLEVEDMVSDEGEYAAFEGAVEIYIVVSRALHLVGLDTPLQRRQARDG